MQWPGAIILIAHHAVAWGHHTRSRQTRHCTFMSMMAPGHSMMCYEYDGPWPLYDVMAPGLWCVMSMMAPGHSMVRHEYDGPWPLYGVL